MSTDTAPRHQVTRMRYEIRRRTLTVQTIEALGPNMRRITFSCDDLNDFASASPDDHIKLFFPQPGEEKPLMRDYTPRRFDTAAGMLVIDFALHEAGPATKWAIEAKSGDTLAIGGPRGSAVVPDDFDWYLLIGDEAALPSIGRRTEELRAGVPVITAVVVDGPDSEQVFAAKSAWQGLWAHRGAAQSGGKEDAARLIAALGGVDLPAGEGFVFIAGETEMARAVKAYVVDTLGHPREWVKAAGYWTRGVADSHGGIED
ncbi:siderophore-interacting protein [Novosphingobium humi]|uniref:Siderophore-interacting protein n=1 Tax=Novosphingobium humi TaxID=2282397 RepID=A0ABY7TW79_9SPHN|nr:siderophore-interacting protein [Novosphingobium humi]WCT77506.1 siderophore-interacting protein [Novosphingobium humi]